MGSKRTFFVSVIVASILLVALLSVAAFYESKKALDSSDLESKTEKPVYAPVLTSLNLNESTDFGIPTLEIKFTIHNNGSSGLNNVRLQVTATSQSSTKLFKPPTVDSKSELYIENATRVLFNATLNVAEGFHRYMHNDIDYERKDVLFAFYIVETPRGYPNCQGSHMLGFENKTVDIIIYHQFPFPNATILTAIPIWSK